MPIYNILHMKLLLHFLWLNTILISKLKQLFSLRRHPIPRISKKYRGFFILARPVNVFISFISILLAAFISGGLSHYVAVLSACLSGAFITAAANAINDYFDIEIDKINKPNRPLPSGAVQPKEAVYFTVICAIIGISFSMFINYTALIIASGSAVLLYFYSYKLKRTVLWGNLTVSLATGLAFIYGGIASASPKHAIIPAMFAFLMHLGREIIKDMEDVNGDQLNKARTMPVVFGLKISKITATCVFTVLFFVTFIPYIFNIYKIWYFIVVMAGVNTVIIFTVFSMWKTPTMHNFRKLSAFLKADMLVGLLAIYMGRI